MALDALGVQNVYLGRYVRTNGSTVEGPSLQDAVAEVDEDLATQLEGEIAASVDATASIRAPFDREIVPSNDEGNARVQAAIDALLRQEATLEDVFVGWGLTVPSPE